MQNYKSQQKWMSFSAVQFSEFLFTASCSFVFKQIHANWCGQTSTIREKKLFALQYFVGILTLRIHDIHDIHITKKIP